MGSKVSKAKIEELKVKFDASDADNDGTLSLAEFHAQAKKLLGDEYDEKATDADFSKADKNGDGRLRLDEYLESHGVKKKVAEKAQAEAEKAQPPSQPAPSEPSPRKQMANEARAEAERANVAEVQALIAPNEL